MNRFFMMRGAPGSGKSTWLNYNDLYDYVVSSDETRLELVGTEIDDDGIERISQANSELVWGAIREEIAYRFSLGQDVILDSTALFTYHMNNYNDLADKYGYDMYIIDFTDVPMEVCLDRNAGRDSLRVVPEAVITRFYEVLPNNPVPEHFVVITPDEAAEIIG